MATQIGIGKSSIPEGFEAGQEAAKLALAQGQIEKGDIAFVFATVGYEQQDLLRGITSVLGNTPVVGCSATGLITRNDPDESLRRVSVSVCKSEKIRFSPVFSQGLKQDSYKVGVDLAQKLHTVWQDNTKALLLLTDGLTNNADALLRGLTDTLKSPIPFVGGSAGESFAFKNTYQYFGSQVMQDSVIGILLSGDFSFDTGVSHGSVPVGITRTVSKAEGNKLYTVDEKPAFDMFKDYLGKETIELDNMIISGVCLGIDSPHDIKGQYEDVILRIPVSVDSADNSLTMVGEWPVGTKIHICRRDPETIITRTQEIADSLNKRHPGTRPSFVMHFNCMGRGKTQLGYETALRELHANQDAFDKDTPWFGLYTYGEIAPVSGKNYFHNWTSVLFAVYD